MYNYSSIFHFKGHQIVSQAQLASVATAVSTNPATTVAVAKHGGQITQQTIATAQLLAQAGLAVQTGAAGTSQATLVKTVAVPSGVTLPVTGVIPQVCGSVIVLKIPVTLCYLTFLFQKT